MAFLNNHNKRDILTTPISNIFIDKYMLKANALFVKVYLYGYRNFYHGVCELTSKQVAEVMQILESDVILSWKYWEEQGLMKLYYNNETNMYDVEYLAIEREVETEKPKTQIKYNFVSTKPQYSPQELSVYKDNSEEIKDLFNYAQNTLNKLLTYNDMNVIFSFYDWLRLPIEVIKILLAYYSDKSIKYIEQVGIQWAENGIDTIDKAEQKMQLNGEYRAIMKAFGLNRMYIGKEEEYMEKWLKTYNFSIEIINVACSKTILAINKPSFKYADSILTKWHQNDIKNLEDIDKLDMQFSQEKKSNHENKTANKNSTKPAKKQNRFVNFKQREWDFAELERLEKEYIKKELER